MDRLDLCLLLTLLLLLLHSGDALRVTIPMVTFGILGCVSSRLRRDPRFWFVAAAAFAATNAVDWFQLDNHKYLLGYWLLALTCSLHTRNAERTLSVNARLLIGFSFLFAVLWKTISSDYTSGSFFHYSLLLDDRFRGIAKLLGGLDEPTIEFNRTAAEALTIYDSDLSTVQLRSSETMRGVLVPIITWWTLAIEALVAALFLLPGRTKLPAWRDFALLAFILSTYAVAPVLGFGWLLAILGIAQADHDARLFPQAYLVAILLLQVYRVPWQALV